MSAVGTVYRREVTSYFTTPIAYVFIPIQLAILSFFFFQFSPFFAAERAEMREFFALMPLMLFIFAPAVTMRLWSEELRVGTSEILLTLPMRLRDVVIAKFLAAFTVLCASLVLTGGIPLTLAWLGSPDWGPVIGGYAGTLLAGSMFIALGCWVSALSENQVVSLLIGVAAGLILVLVCSPGFAAYLSGSNPNLARIVEELGVISHFSSVERGVIALSDIVYFFSGTVFFLALTITTIEAKRY